MTEYARILTNVARASVRLSSGGRSTQRSFERRADCYGGCMRARLTAIVTAALLLAFASPAAAGYTRSFGPGSLVIPSTWPTRIVDPRPTARLQPCDRASASLSSIRPRPGTTPRATRQATSARDCVSRAPACAAAIRPPAPTSRSVRASWTETERRRHRDRSHGYRAALRDRRGSGGAGAAHRGVERHVPLATNPWAQRSVPRGDRPRSRRPSTGMCMRCCTNHRRLLGRQRADRDGVSARRRHPAVEWHGVPRGALRGWRVRPRHRESGHAHGREHHGRDGHLRRAQRRSPERLALHRRWRARVLPDHEHALGGQRSRDRAVRRWRLPRHASGVRRRDVHVPRPRGRREVRFPRFPDALLRRVPGRQRLREHRAQSCVALPRRRGAKRALLTTTGMPPDCPCTDADSVSSAAALAATAASRDVKERGAGFMIAAQPDENTLQIQPRHPVQPARRLMHHRRERARVQPEHRTRHDVHRRRGRHAITGPVAPRSRRG